MREFTADRPAMDGKRIGPSASRRQLVWLPKEPARALGGRLRRAQTLQRSLGIEIVFGREGRLGTRTIRITAMSENRSPNTVSTVSGVNDNGHRAGQNHPPSAYRMPRAVGVFRKAGFPVEPYPVDWRTRGVEDVLHPFATMSDGLRQTDTAVHEWVGLAVYWLTGRSSELFPVAA